MATSKTFTDDELIARNFKIHAEAPQFDHEHFQVPMAVSEEDYVRLPHDIQQQYQAAPADDSGHHFAKWHVGA